MTTAIDYAQSGLDIQAAMVDQFHRFPLKADRPRFLLWNGIAVKTSDAIAVPRSGIVTATFLSAKVDVSQGFDMKLDGWLELSGGEHVPVLRTWYDERYESKVIYPFFSRDGVLWFWNVHKRQWPDGGVTEEKWTGNAGFWVEEASEGRRIYHCSHGMAQPPDFESLLIEITINKLQNNKPAPR